MDQPRKILFVNHVARMSGAERSLADLVLTLDRSRYQPTVALPDGGELATLLAARGICTYPLRLGRLYRTRNPFTLLTYAAQLLAAAHRLVSVIRSENIALVHCNSSTAMLAGGLACRRTEIPCIWHCRDLADPGLPGRLMIRWATRIIAISDSVAQQLADASRPGQVVTVRNGIDPDAFKPTGRRMQTRRELDIPDNAFVVATIGQLVPWKRHELFIEAAARVGARLAHARFMLVGTDLFGDHAEYVAALRRQAMATGLGERIAFMGHRCDVAAIIEAADVIVHPASREPFGRVVAEAMSMGKPVVAVNAAGPAEIIRHDLDGVLVPPDDPGAIAQACLDLAMSGTTAVAIGDAARDRIVTAFNLERVCRETMQVYDEVLAAGGTP